MGEGQSWQNGYRKHVPYGTTLLRRQTSLNSAVGRRNFVDMRFAFGLHSAPEVFIAITDTLEPMGDPAARGVLVGHYLDKEATYNILYSSLWF